jgi:tRNA (cytidine/uridine-2'-O-)-methyltransferase
VFNVVLFEPEIPPNTGNVIRLCANSGTSLHLVKPLGFDINHRQLKRAGLDYHELANLTIYDDWVSCARALSGARMFAVSTKGSQRYDQIIYRQGDVFLFGPETRGLPSHLLDSFVRDRKIRIPMAAANRSMNLSNAVAVVVFEAWRQLGFAAITPTNR